MHGNDGAFLRYLHDGVSGYAQPASSAGVPDPGRTRHHAGSGEELNEVGGMPVNWAQHPEEAPYFLLVDAAEDARCINCGLEKESSSHLLCECDAFASITHGVFGLDIRKSD